MVHAFVFGVVLCAAIVVHAQNNPEVVFEGNGVPLDRALLELRKAYDIAVVYDSRALRSIKVSADGTPIAFEALLARWLTDSGYTYELLEETYIIRKRKPMTEQNRPEFNVALHGRVVDEVSGEGLPFATLTVMGTYRGAISNERGWFYLTDVPADTSAITVSYVGYVPRTIRAADANDAAPMRVELQPARALLPIAVVREAPTSRIVQALSPSLVTVDNGLSEYLPNTGEPDPIRNLQLLPGVSGALENSANLHIRGGAADENLVLYDGFTIYHLDHFYGLFSALNNNAIQNIRLHKGVFEPMYGGRGASVIEVTGKQGNRKNPLVKTDVSMLSAAVHLEAPILGNRAGLMLSARRSFTDVLFTPVYQNLFNNLYGNATAGGPPIEGGTFGGDQAPDFNFYDLTAKVAWESESNDQFSFTVYSGRDRLNMQFLERTRDNRFMFEYNDRSRWGNTGVGARWARQWDEATHGTLTIGYSTFQSELFGFDRRTNAFLGTQDTLFFDRDTEISDLSLRYDFSHQRGRHAFRFGTANTAHRVENSRIDSEGINDRDIAAENTLTLYVQDTYKVNQQLEVTAGVRTNYYTGFDRFFHEPRLLLQYRATQKLTLHSAVGRTWQFIRNVRRQDLFLNTADEWRLAADGALPALVNDQLSAGVSIDLGIVKADVEGYVRTSSGSIEDALRFIAFEPGSFTDDLLTGTGSAYGAEFLLRKEAGKHAGWIAYTWSKAGARFVELDNREVPAYFDRRHEVNAAYAFTTPKYRFNAVFVYGSGLPFTTANGVYNVPLPNGETRPLVAFSSLNAARLPDYHRLDVSVTRTFIVGNGRALAGLSLYNVYNRQNVRNRYFFSSGTVENELLVDFSDIQFLGFVPSVRLAFEW